MKNILCQACLKDGEDVSPMAPADINWFNRLVKEVQNEEMFMCMLCTSLFRKMTVFIEQCQRAQILLKQVYSQELQVLPPPIGRNISISPTKTLYVGPEHLRDLDLDFKGDDSFFDCNEAYVTEDEDDVPLVLFSKEEKEEAENEELVKAKVKKKKLKTLGLKSRNTTKRQKVVREGFSSRMVQETPEYLVIKLTKEQVLEEMRERATSDKYLRAPYKCEQCVKGFNFEDVLLSHMDRHSPKNGSLRCDLCSQCCPSAVSLRGHLKSHTTRYKCKLCGYMRHSRQHVLEHYTISHSDSSAAYSCEKCPFTTNKRTVMQRHVRLHGRTERHTCHKCGKLYKTLESLRVHTIRHENKKRFQCDQCNLSFVYPTLLQKHVQSVHVRRDFYCVECDIKFKSMDTLKLHFKRAKRHRDTTPNKCTDMEGKGIKHVCASCPRSYSSRAALRAHMRRHATDTLMSSNESL